MNLFSRWIVGYTKSRLWSTLTGHLSFCPLLRTMKLIHPISVAWNKLSSFNRRRLPGSLSGYLGNEAHPFCGENASTRIALISCIVPHLYSYSSLPIITLFSILISIYISI